MLFSSSDESHCFTQVENTFICALRFQGQGEDIATTGENMSSSSAF